MPNDLLFEPLKEADIPSILEIEKECNTAPWSEQSFRNELVNAQSVFIVARSAGKLVGYGGYWSCIDEAHITTLAVSPAERRQGIGKAIMVELLKRAKDAGIQCSTLEVRASNEAAIKLYEGLRYRSTARRKGYYPDNKEDAIVMWLHDLQSWQAP